MNLEEQIKEARVFSDQSFDSKDFSDSLLRNDPANSVFPKVRNNPCSDCAVMDGLYSDIAACAYKYLDKNEKAALTSRWDCHNGGRCEGAFLVVNPTGDRAMTYKEFEQTLKAAGVVEVLSVGGQSPFQLEATLPAIGENEKPCMYFRVRGTDCRFEVYPSAELVGDESSAIVSVVDPPGYEPDPCKWITFEDVLPVIVAQLREALCCR